MTAIGFVGYSCATADRAAPATTTAATKVKQIPSDSFQAPIADANSADDAVVMRVAVDVLPLPFVASLQGAVCCVTASTSLRRPVFISNTKPRTATSFAIQGCD